MLISLQEAMAIPKSLWPEHLFTSKSKNYIVMDAWDKRSDLVLWEDLEGAGGEGGGRGDRDGEDM